MLFRFDQPFTKSLDDRDGIVNCFSVIILQAFVDFDLQIGNVLIELKVVVDYKI